MGLCAPKAGVWKVGRPFREDSLSGLGSPWGAHRLLHGSCHLLLPQLPVLMPAPWLRLVAVGEVSLW